MIQSMRGARLQNSKIVGHNYMTVWLQRIEYFLSVQPSGTQVMEEGRRRLRLDYA